MSLQSESINELMGALAKAQREMSHAVKDSTNPHFKSRFADLASVWQACREPLSKNGLAVTQTMDLAGERQILVTTLGHSSGQWIKSIMPLPIQKTGPQEIGSCLTYCRRYALAAMVGVYQDDDDGEAATKQSREPTKVSAVPAPSFITEGQVNLLNMYITEYPKSKEWLFNKFGIDSVSKLPGHMYDYVFGEFKKKDEEKGKTE